jgi:hypothetical protein
MDDQEQSYKRAEELYRLAHLFMGDRELSMNLVLETIHSQNGSEGLFALGMHASLRKQFIARVLARFRGKLSLSATRLVSEQTEEELPSAGGSFDPSSTAAHIEHVLLAIDIFPRCALLLTVFERFSLDDASILISSHPQMVLKGRIAGLRGLTRRLAKMGNCHPSSQIALTECEVRHAY